MSLSISPLFATIKPYQRLQLAGAGGVPPYSYAIVNPAKAALDQATGLLTASSSVESVTVRVTDSDPLGPFTADAQVRVTTPEHLLCDIIQSEMGLADAQVWLWDQKIDMGNDTGLKVVVGVQSNKAFANSRRYVDDGNGGLNEELSTNYMVLATIDILSRSTEARDRRDEVLEALASTYSQQVQEANAFKIARLPSQFTNLSFLEPAAIPYRFQIVVALQYSITKTKAVPFYDTFVPPTVALDP